LFLTGAGRSIADNKFNPGFIGAQSTFSKIFALALNLRVGPLQSDGRRWADWWSICIDRAVYPTRYINTISETHYKSGLVTWLSLGVFVFFLWWGDIDSTSPSRPGTASVPSLAVAV
jgi:hypothetical protein